MTEPVNPEDGGTQSKVQVFTLFGASVPNEVCSKYSLGTPDTSWIKPLLALLTPKEPKETLLEVADGSNAQSSNPYLILPGFANLNLKVNGEEAVPKP